MSNAFSSRLMRAGRVLQFCWLSRLAVVCFLSIRSANKQTGEQTNERMVAARDQSDRVPWSRSRPRLQRRSVWIWTRTHKGHFITTAALRHSLACDGNSSPQGEQCLAFGLESLPSFLEKWQSALSVCVVVCLHDATSEICDSNPCYVTQANRMQSDGLLWHMNH